MPAKIKQETWDEIIAYVKGGLSNRDAFTLAGISESIFYKKLREDLQYLQLLKSAETSFKQYHLDKIRKEKSWQASAWLLERKFKEEFARLEQHENKDVDEFAHMKDEEIEEEIKKIEQTTKNKVSETIKGETIKIGT